MCWIARQVKSTYLYDLSGTGIIRRDIWPLRTSPAPRRPDVERAGNGYRGKKRPSARIRSKISSGGALRDYRSDYAVSKSQTDLCARFGASVQLTKNGWKVYLLPRGSRIYRRFVIIKNHIRLESLIIGGAGVQGENPRPDRRWTTSSEGDPGYCSSVLVPFGAGASFIKSLGWSTPFRRYFSTNTSTSWTRYRTDDRLSLPSFTHRGPPPCSRQNRIRLTGTESTYASSVSRRRICPGRGATAIALPDRRTLDFLVVLLFIRLLCVIHRKTTLADHEMIIPCCVNNEVYLAI
jgi:hypothetical protein